MKRILITGATGFVGRHALACFRTRFAGAAEIVGTGRKPRPAGLPKDLGYAAADLADRRAVVRLLREVAPTDILHLAAESSVAEATARPVRAWDSNVANLVNLIAPFVELGASANFFFVSSAEVYGHAFLSGQPLAEDVTPAPISTYARTKLAGEEMLRDALAGARGGRLAILQPFNHIGPGQDERFAVPSYAAQIARFEAGLASPVLEVGDLSTRRDFMDVRDVVDAYAELIAASDRLERVCLYNLCSGQARTSESLLSELGALSRVPFEIKVARDHLRASEIPSACGDASAIAARIHWRPRRSLRDTLGAVLDHARAGLDMARTRDQR